MSPTWSPRDIRPPRPRREAAPAAAAPVEPGPPAPRPAPSVPAPPAHPPAAPAIDARAIAREVAAAVAAELRELADRLQAIVDRPAAAAPDADEIARAVVARIRAGSTPPTRDAAGCRWIVGPGAATCGVEAVPGKPYCVEHADRAYRRDDGRRPPRAP